ncbi:TRAP transporter small permease subunit [Stella sp.]|uniref:TRAP transporter small permease subunit n=1 Tax=Stella sp. TaxID=2912054 RepID=UPI0035ADAFBB
MSALAAFVRWGEAVNHRVGEWVKWLTLATVLVCATVVFIRYALHTGLIWLQDLYVWIHGAVFMLGAGYTFMANKHVRVDIYYARRSRRTQAWLDLVSTIVFLFPWILVLGWYGWPYVLASFALQEPSSQVGGMPGLFVLKATILVFCLLMGLQGLVVLARSVLTIAGREALLPAAPAVAEQ